MQEIIQNFDLITYRAWADLRSEARRYYISYLWWVVEPVLEMFVFYVVFGILMQRGIPDFLPFLLIGLTAWKWFSTTVRHGANAIFQARHLIHQINLPKIVLPTIVLLTDTFKFLVVLVLLVAFIWLYGLKPQWAYLGLPLVLGTQFLLIAAIAYFFSAIIPFLPDIDILLANALRLIFFLSGIFFDGQNLPLEYQKWFYLNPMATIIEAYRGIFMHGQYPNFSALAVISLLSLVAIALSRFLLRIFDKLYPRVTNQ